MEDNHHKQRHTCKFCYKSFPCGRSLGGHMRSHMIDVSPDDYKDTNEKIPKKKLPPLVNGKISLKENLKKANRSLKSSKEDTLLQGKICKECGKSFTSWQTLFGHMKCHSGKEDSSDSCNNNRAKPITDSQSDNEAATPLIKRKRSDRRKRYRANYTTSSSLTVANLSPSVSEIDQQDQEEVALSLIMLSRDTRNQDGMDSFAESSDNIHELVETRKVSEADKFKKLSSKILKRVKILPSSNNDLQTRKLEDSADKFSTDNESEVNSPRKMMRKCGSDRFETEIKKKIKSRKRMSLNSNDSELSLPLDYKNKLELSYGPREYELLSQDHDRKIKFECTVCKKSFPSYQALGGHRASHKKFKDCCDSTNSNIKEAGNPSNPNFDDEDDDKLVKHWNSSKSLIGDLRKSTIKEVGSKANKEHECSICYKVFPSGQSLGGHKRSHVINGDQAKASSFILLHKTNNKPMKETRDFLDLNLPAPIDEECSNEFKPWWVETNGHKHEIILGLLSS